MRLRFLIAQLVALALILTAPIAWATSSTTISVASDQWYDLGIGPSTIQALSAPMMYRIDDSQPLAAAPGIALPLSVPRDVSASTHIWARTGSGLTNVLVAPLAASSGGGGGAITAADGALTTLGSEADAACGTDNGSCTVEAVLKRVAQRITSLIAATLAVTDSTTETNTGSTATNTSTTNADLGAPGATACSTDTGSCSANALLQRIAQRITSLIGSTLGIAGNVGGYTGSVCVTPTITASTYSANNVIGGLLTFSNAFRSAGSGVLESVAVNSKTVQTAGLTFVPFHANPSNTTWTDHAAAAINAADVFAVREPVTLSTAFSGLGTHTNWSTAALGIGLAPGSTTLYGVLLANATTSAFGSTSDVQVCVKILQD